LTREFLCAVWVLGCAGLLKYGIDHSPLKTREFKKWNC
tara:strand:+ start:220 stop:333 length:114 start_codon:yes stop_codon:yes gene_type:complete